MDNHFELRDRGSSIQNLHSSHWTDEVEELCEKLRVNSVNLAEYHRLRYYHFKSYGKYFRLPMILLASLNSTASVGLQPLLAQEVISGITCIIGVIMGIISSLEMYLGIHDSMQLELKQSKEFYTLSVDLFKTLSLQRENRGEDGRDYLNKKYSQYIKMVEASNLLKRKLKIDMLTVIPREYTDGRKTPSNSGSEVSLKNLDIPSPTHLERSINMPYDTQEHIYDAEKNELPKIKTIEEHKVSEEIETKETNI